MGVNRVVVKDKVFLNNRGLIEDTFDRYAEDKEGNVWYFGEKTKGNCITARSKVPRSRGRPGWTGSSPAASICRLTLSERDLPPGVL